MKLKSRSNAHQFSPEINTNNSKNNDLLSQDDHVETTFDTRDDCDNTKDTIDVRSVHERQPERGEHVR